MHIALLAGEASGDQLGAELIKSLRQINPCIRFDGVGGPLMQEQGFNSLLPIDEFSVMGLTEIIHALPRLLHHKRFLLKNYSNTLPDAFIGIDYPEFNFRLEKDLKELGIYTAHYVSPSVWAWREKRIHKIKASCDLILPLFEFEKEFYDKHDVPAVYCGHPLVDIIPASTKTDKARISLGIEVGSDIRYLAVLPGSRISEVKKMLPIFIQVVKKLLNKTHKLHLLIPAVTDKLMVIIQEMLTHEKLANIATVFCGQGKLAMQASDAILLSSGTAALEAMLLEKPMVVSYKVSKVTAFFASRMINISHFSLPNLLAGDSVVPEYIQDNINYEKMSDELHELINPSDYRNEMINQLISLRKLVKGGASEAAAQAIYDDVMRKDLMANEK